MGDYANCNSRTANNYDLIYRNIYRNFRQSSIGSTAKSSDRHQILESNYSLNSQILEKFSLLVLQSLNQENNLEALLLEVRQALKADRVLILRLGNHGSTIVAESVAAGWPEALNEQIDDLGFSEAEDDTQQHQSSRVHAINNIYQAKLTDIQIEILQQLAVKASLVAPIIRNNQMLGWLIAHQCSAQRQWQLAEIDLFGQMASQMAIALEYTTLLAERQTVAKQAQLLTSITQSIRSSMKSQDLLNTTVREVRQALHADRVLVYCYQPDWSGIIVAQSLAPGCPRALNHQLDDPCFRERYAELYRSGHVHAISNIYKAGLTPHHISNLERFAVKSKLIAPIIKDGRLFGLLIAHQCIGFREWQQSEIDLFAQITVQVGFALEQADLREKIEQISQIATQVTSALEQAERREKMEQIPREVHILPEEKEHDATVTFAELS